MKDWTYNDAYAALVEYNKNPYDLEPSITMQELYDKWLPEYEKTVKSTKSATSAWAYCSGVYKMRVMDIRARHVKGCMEEGGGRHPRQGTASHRHHEEPDQIPVQPDAGLRFGV